MNNEEKILAMLEKLTEEVGRHNEQLSKQGDQLAKQWELLAKQGEQLAKQGELLAKQGEHLAKLDEKLEELDNRSLRSAVMLENDVLPKLQLLYEGQVHLQETLAPKVRVEVLEDELVSLKSTVKTMLKRLDALEKAQ